MVKTFWSRLSISVLFLCLLQGTFAQTGTIVATAEAEQGILEGGVTIANTNPGYSGIGYVTNFRNTTDKVTVTVNIPTRNYYKLVIRYSAPNGEKYQKLIINGKGSGSIKFPFFNSFTDADAGIYILDAGKNTLTLQSDWGWMDVDKFTVYSYTYQKHTYNITPDLVNPDANQEAKSLYANLLLQFTKKIISGQTNDWYDKIKLITGKIPLLRAFDFQHYTQGYPYLWDNTINGFKFGAEDDGQVKKAIDWYNATSKTGLVNFHWHWHSPSGGNVGINTFYTNSTTFDITKAVTEGTAENAAILKDIDTIAYQLKRLQDAGVPVLWRPLHEAGGGWFWWGAKGPEPCKKLYRIMYDRMTNYHHLNNLIWIWSTPESTWYPGNELVDIIGHDSYPGAYVYDAKKNDFDILFNLVGGKKLIAMTENGPIPDPDDCLLLDAPWAWFMSWSDLVASQNTTQHITDVFTNKNVLTLENPDAINEVPVLHDSGIRVYPNPAKEIIYFDSGDFSGLELIDLTGKTAFSATRQINSIPTESFPDGLYILRIHKNCTTNQVKIIIKR